MSGPKPPPADAQLLRRQIGLYAATAITVGSIIGSGIFRSPHSVAQELTLPTAALFAWVLGGVLSLCGSLALAEMAVTHPRTGGLYVFIRESFGDRLGFIFGWASLWVIKPTVIASIASVFATYFCQAVGLGKGAEFFAWTPDGDILSASGNQVFRWRSGQPGWEIAAQFDEAGLQKISRLAVSPTGDRIALVADEPSSPQ